MANLPHVVLNDLFRFVVERAGGFVENQDARVGDQGAGDGDALALSARQACAVFSDFSVVAFRQFTMNSCAPASLAASIIASIATMDWTVQCCRGYCG